MPRGSDLLAEAADLDQAVVAIALSATSIGLIVPMMKDPGVADRQRANW